MSRSRTRCRATTAVALTLTLLGALGAGTATAGPVPASTTARDARSYTNPVSAEFADTFADPSVIRGKDGWWYAVATTDPLREGEAERHLIPTARSADLVSWEYVGDAFTEGTPDSNLPTWADTANGASIWAADLRYVDGEYRLYYVVTQTTVTPELNDNALGVATAPTPTGPWTDSGAPVVGPRRGPGGGDGNFLWTFDPTHVRDEATGQQYLFYGSYYGGIWTVPLDGTGTRAAGPETQITIDNKYEGAYVIERDGYYYLFVSSANCCNGAATGYSVHVGRSESITGPYVDRQGVPLLQSRAGGTPVIAPNGNRWIGTGHNAVVTDLAGQDWIVYHALDRDDPYLTGDQIGSITERPMLIDRLDWVDGWPTARAGLWASDDRQEGPVASGRRVVNGFDSGSGSSGGWRVDRSWTVADGVATSTGTDESRITRRARSRDGVRVEADVRLGSGPAGLEATLRDGTAVQATVSATGELFVTYQERGGSVAYSTTDAVGPEANFDGSDWHSLVLTVADGVATAELSDARLNDPLAQTEPLQLDRAGRGGAVLRAGAVAWGAGSSIDNLSVAEVAEPVDAVEPEPLGTLDPALSDEFDGPLDERWQRLRDPQVTVAGGELSWPVQYADLGGPGPSPAALLLQDAPEGDWTVETSVDVSALGVDDVRNYQQGGIVVYLSDDRWVRLSTVAIWNTRQNEFGVELPWPTAGRPDDTIQGGTIAGPPGERSWLRVQKRTNAETGELVLSSFTSNDGVTWVQGGAWTMPAGSDPRVGLFSGGATEGTPAAELTFDYLRWYLP